MLWLCRALLAALAVLCTLSRIHANGQSTQRLDRIKDLMCVLLLSGVQKEDLDENMLNKLQRYNVNIRDLNNKDLLQECTLSHTLKTQNMTTQTIENKSEVQNFSRKKNDQNNKQLNNSTNIFAQDYNNFLKNSFEKENDEKKHIIQYVDGQPELKSVLNFWKDVKVNNSSEITENPIHLNTARVAVYEKIKSEQKNKRNVQDSDESDIIQKLLANFLLKRQNRKMDNAVTININNEDLKRDVYHFGTKNIRSNTDNRNDNADISQQNIDEMQRDMQHLKSGPRKNMVLPKILNRSPEKEKLKTINTNNYNDIFNALQSLKSIILNDDNNKKSNRYSKETVTSEKSYVNNFSAIDIFTTEKPLAAQTTERVLSSNVIEEIAKSVKELVLRDIRKEMFQTSYTTMAVPITTKAEEKPTIKGYNADQSILNKFMDLYEEIKSLNHNTLVISQKIRKETPDRDESIHPAIHEIDTFNNYKMKQNSNPNSQRIFNYSPQIHKFRSNFVSESVLQVPIKPTMPITVQTNNMEIPPLGIPVDKPENPINQNIIVPTMRPYRIGGYKFDNQMNIPNANIEANIPKKSQIRLLKSEEPNLYYSNHPNDKQFAFHNEQSGDNANFNKRILSRYKGSDHRNDEIKHSDIQRFHEKLERDVENIPPHVQNTDRVDCCNERYAYSKQMIECCNRKIASRQQMSLNRVKKQHSYDDTHFNNFLKSQQKVTDMLERILASRTRVRSVETA